MNDINVLSCSYNILQTSIVELFFPKILHHVLTLRGDILSKAGKFFSGRLFGKLMLRFLNAAEFNCCTKKYESVNHFYFHT